MRESQKVTYQLSTDVVMEVRQAVEEGYAPSISRFVEEAMRNRLRAIREGRIKKEMEEASHDPQVGRDVAKAEIALPSQEDRRTR